jgi:hypothetical protein
VTVIKGQTDRIIVNELVAGEGWKLRKTLNVKPDQEVVRVTLQQPGLYQLTKGLAGEIPEKILANDEAVGSRPFFALLDLYLDNTIIPASELITYIDNRLLEWQYVLIDIKSKTINYGDPSAITLSYKRHANDNTSPNAVTFARLSEDELGEKMREVVRQIMENNGDSIENVFVFKSNIPVPLMEHRPQTVELHIDGLTEFAKLPVPDISTINIRGNNSLIYYNI